MRIRARVPRLELAYQLLRLVLQGSSPPPARPAISSRCRSCHPRPSRGESARPICSAGGSGRAPAPSTPGTTTSTRPASTLTVPLGRATPRAGPAARAGRPDRAASDRRGRPVDGRARAAGRSGEEMANEHADAAVACLYDFVHAIGRRDPEGAMACVADDFHVYEDDREIDRLALRHQIEALLDSLRDWELEISLAEVPEPLHHPGGILIYCEIQVDAFQRDSSARRSRVSIAVHRARGAAGRAVADRGAQPGRRAGLSDADPPGPAPARPPMRARLTKVSLLTRYLFFLVRRPISRSNPHLPRAAAERPALAGQPARGGRLPGAGRGHPLPAGRQPGQLRPAGRAAPVRSAAARAVDRRAALGRRRVGPAAPARLPGRRRPRPARARPGHRRRRRDHHLPAAWLAQGRLPRRQCRRAVGLPRALGARRRRRRRALLR